MRNVGEVVVVSIAGAIVGGVVGLLCHIHWVGVSLAALVGGLVGYMLYQPRQVLAAISEAWRASSKGLGNLTWEKAKPVFKGIWAALTIVMAAYSWFPLCFWLTDRFDPTGFACMLCTFGAVEVMIMVGSERENPGQPQTVFSKKCPVAFMMWKYANVIAGVFWIIYGIFSLLRLLYWKLRDTNIWAPRVWLALRVFLVVFFRKVHCCKRGVCGLSAASGAVMLFCTKSLLFGMSFAAVIALLTLAFVALAVRSDLPERVAREYVLN